MARRARARRAQARRAQARRARARRASARSSPRIAWVHTLKVDGFTVSRRACMTAPRVRAFAAAWRPHHGRSWFPGRGHAASARYIQNPEGAEGLHPTVESFGGLAASFCRCQTSRDCFAIAAGDGYCGRSVAFVQAPPRASLSDAGGVVGVAGCVGGACHAPGRATVAVAEAAAARGVGAGNVTVGAGPGQAGGWGLRAVRDESPSRPE